MISTAAHVEPARGDVDARPGRRVPHRVREQVEQNLPKLFAIGAGDQLLFRKLERHHLVFRGGLRRDQRLDIGEHGAIATFAIA